MGLIAEASLTPYVFLLLLIAVIGWLMFRITRRLNQKEPTRRTPPMTNAAHHSGAASPQQFDRWSIEMQDLARDALAQIDTKMRALDYLTRQATAATERLEAALAEANPPSQPDVKPTQRREAPVSHTAPESLEAHNQADALERTTGRSHQTEEASDTDAEPRRQLIYELADRGVDTAAIAAAVGSPTGEVELILGLRRPQVQDDDSV